MKIRLILSILIFAWCGMGISLDASESDKEIHVRVAAYNVEFGKNASPEEIGRMFKPYNLDIIGFNEVPDGEGPLALAMLGNEDTVMWAKFHPPIIRINTNPSLAGHPCKARSSMNSLFSVGVHGTRHPWFRQSLK